MIDTLFTTTPDQILLLTLLLPFAAALLVAVNHNYPNIRETMTVLVSVFTFINAFQLLIWFIHGKRIAITIAHIAPGLEIAFAIEPLGMIFGLIASFLWIITTIYSIGYMRGNDEPRQTQFYVCFAIAIGCTLCIAFSANLLTLFIFYELLTISTYPLVTHHGDSKSRHAGRTYLGILIGSSITLFLPAIIWTWYMTGTLDFSKGGILSGESDKLALSVLFFLYIYGIGKAALMPLHRWLPAAMVAPSPVSALLHAVAVVKAGVFTIVKIIVYIFGVDLLQKQFAGPWWQGSWLIYVAGATILLASIVALRQDDLKKRLAYSTVSQLSYVILAAATLATKSIAAAAFHIAAHAFAKITLFFAAGSIYTASGKKYVYELNGIGKRMPWTMGAFTIAAISMIGLPPTAGFISKWYMLSGAFENQVWTAAIVIILSTLFNAVYFLPVIYAAFFKKENVTTHGTHFEHKEAPFPIVYALVITAAMTLWLFFMPDTFMQLSNLLVAP